ncbi:hypothetical protein [Stenotrophobium rhamnosiphilum]|nr:hypothetical protein [Stenotrophobium rhamnosiphilum]
MSLSGLTPFRRRAAPLLICLSWALTGCATYKPPALPASQKATLYVSQFPYSMSFQKMDGVDVALGSSWRTVKMKSLELAPGRHTVSIEITMRFFEQTFDGSTNVSFVAKPGKTYVIRTQINSSDHQSLRAWVEQSKRAVPDP